jgi:predicted dehydrogenase
MKKVLIFGSGSIGNHLANACRKIKFSVFVTDISPIALLRMKNEIYPTRYSKWDNKIQLVDYTEVFKLKKKFDLILIGTPPATHCSLMKKILDNLTFEKLMIEKPFTTYNNRFNEKKLKLLTKKKIFVGYNHSISKAFLYYRNLIKKIKKKDIKIIYVNWREGWKGILNAHFWNKDEFSSYLGNFSQGGGCIHEHSHGIHLIICLSEILNFTIPNKMVKFKFFDNKNKNKNIYYDNYINVNWKNKDFSISYVSDLISEPANKSICIYTKRTKFELIFNYKKNYDLIKSMNLKSNLTKLKYFKKRRSTDFISEIKHIINTNSKQKYKNSFINFEKAMETQKLINTFCKYE